IEADAHAADEHLAVLAIVGVQGVVVRPLVVSLPGVVRALKHEVRRAIIADDKDEVTLIAMALGRQLAKVDAADPDLRDLQGVARVPATFAQALLADARGRLCVALERPEFADVPAALALVVTKAVQVEGEVGGWRCADEEVDALGGPDAGARGE